MTVNVKNVQTLIDHYKALPGVPTWSYRHCVAGVLANLGIIEDYTRKHHYDIADALGIDLGQTLTIIYGDSYFYLNDTDTKRRDVVVNMLEGLLAMGTVNWRYIPDPI
jgi:hypothetical protein